MKEHTQIAEAGDSFPSGECQRWEGDYQFNDTDGAYSLSALDYMHSILTISERYFGFSWDSEEVEQYLEWVSLSYGGPLGPRTAMPVWALRILAIKVREKYEGIPPTNAEVNFAMEQWRKYQVRQALKARGKAVEDNTLNVKVGVD